MSKHIMRVCMVMFGLALVSAVIGEEPAVAPVMVDNPAYLSWAEFAPGTSTTYTVTTTTGEVTTETTITYTLKEVTENKVVLTLDTVTVSDEGTEETTPEAIECPAKIEKTETPKPVEEGKETITVGDEQIATTWTKTKTADGTTTVWTSDTVPGGTAKSVIVSTLDEETTTVTMVLTSYDVAAAEEEPEPVMKGK